MFGLFFNKEKSFRNKVVYNLYNAYQFHSFDSSLPMRDGVSYYYAKPELYNKHIDRAWALNMNLDEATHYVVCKYCIDLIAEYDTGFETKFLSKITNRGKWIGTDNKDISERVGGYTNELLSALDKVHKCEDDYKEALNKIKHELNEDLIADEFLTSNRLKVREFILSGLELDFEGKVYLLYKMIFNEILNHESFVKKEISNSHTRYDINWFSEINNHIETWFNSSKCKPLLKIKTKTINKKINKNRDYLYPQ